MKGILKIFLAFVMAIGICSFCYGTGEKIVYLDFNSKSIELNKELEITVNIQSFKTSAYTLYLYFDNEKLEYVSGPDNTNVVGNKIISVWYDVTGGSSPKENVLDKFVFKTKDVGTSVFNINGEFYNSDGEETSVQFIKDNLYIGDGAEVVNESENKSLLNANLETLDIQDILLTPVFDANVTNYTVEVSNNVNILNIFAVPENEKAVVEVLGNGELKEGDNIIQVIVTAEDGITRKIYVITAHKRNSEEEVIYEEKQEENNKQLEAIYKAEKISMQTDNFEDSKSILEDGSLNQQNLENNVILKNNVNFNNKWIFLVLFIILILVIILLKKFLNNKKKR